MKTQAVTELVKIDGVKWYIEGKGTGRIPRPLCPKHDLRLRPIPLYSEYYGRDHELAARELRCYECPEPYEIRRTFNDELRFVLDKIDSRAFRAMKTINLDDEAVPLATDRIESKDSPFWLEAKLVESKTGPKVVIYAGDKRMRNKTQLFVDPQTQRLGFDQSDSHPTDVFVTVEATFKDGAKMTIVG